MSEACITQIIDAPKNKQTIIPVSRGEEKCTPNHSWGPGVRSLYIIHYVIDGSGTFYCGTKKYTVNKGQIFVIFPRTIVKYQADSQNPWHYSWVTFTGEDAKEILSGAGLTLRNPVATIKSRTEALEALRAMPSERTAELSENLKFSARLYDFFSAIIPRESAEITKSAYLTTATRFIKAHYIEDITVDSVASHVGIGRKYLFTIFKELLGTSPKDYITDYRIKRAEEYLLNETLSIGSVAYSVGYRDSLAFSKIFKSKTGLSPSEYREKNRTQYEV